MFKTRLFTNNLRAVSVLGVAAVSYNLYRPINLESINNVIVDKSLDPFPTKLSNFKLIGHGMRSVTFLGFNVYGIGIYFDENNSKQVKNILGDYDLTTDLNNEKSVEIISKIIDTTDFRIRISPVRNTDFNHLKDGFIKSILSSPLKKEYGDKANEGLDEIRNIFKNFKGSVPKNHILLLSTNNGSLSFTYENTKTGEIKEIGKVNEKVVSKLLLLCYLSNAKPLSESLRTSCNQGWNELI